MHFENILIIFLFNNQKQIKMKNSSKNTVKNVSAIVSPIETKKEGLKRINFEKFANALDSFEIKEKSSKEHLYIYTDDVIQKGINSDAGKSFRGRMRNKLENLCNAVLIAYKQKNEENLNSAIEKFKSNYLEFYTVNDYSFSSFARTDKNKFIIESAIAIVKETL